MGTSYQTLLVIAEPATLRSAAHELGVGGWLVAAGPQRSAILPREGDDDYVDVRRLAKLLSTKVGPALSNEAVDSDAVVMAAYRDGRLVHEYVSDQAMLVDWFIDDDGRSRFRLGDREYPADAPTPRGPAGADPHTLAPYGIAPVDLDRLGAALHGEFAGATGSVSDQSRRLSRAATEHKSRRPTSDPAAESRSPASSRASSCRTSRTGPAPSRSMPVPASKSVGDLATRASIATSAARSSAVAAWTSKDSASDRS